MLLCYLFSAEQALKSDRNMHIVDLAAIFIANHEFGSYFAVV